MSNTPAGNSGRPDVMFGLPHPGPMPPAPMYDWPEVLNTVSPREPHVESASTYQTRADLQRGTASVDRTNSRHAFVEDAEETENEQVRNGRTTEDRSSSNKRPRRTVDPTYSEDEESDEATDRRELECFKKNSDLINEIILNLQALPKDLMREEEMIPKKDGRVLSAYEWPHALLRSLAALSRVRAGGLERASEALFTAWKANRRRKVPHVIVKDVRRAEEILRAFESIIPRSEVAGDRTQSANEESELVVPTRRAITPPLRANTPVATALGAGPIQAAGEMSDTREDQALATATNEVPERRSQDCAMEKNSSEARIRESLLTPCNNANDIMAIQASAQHKPSRDRSFRVQTTEGPATRKDATVQEVPQKVTQADLSRVRVDHNKTPDTEAQNVRTGVTLHHDSDSDQIVKLRWGPEDSVDIDSVDRVLCVKKRKATEYLE